MPPISLVPSPANLGPDGIEAVCTERNNDRKMPVIIMGENILILWNDAGEGDCVFAKRMWFFAADDLWRLALHLAESAE